MKIINPIHGHERYVFCFDFDEIFRDTTNSYEKCVIETVKEFTGEDPDHNARMELKNTEHNDWKRTLKLIEMKNKNPGYDDVVNCFQDMYLGKNRDFTGYINDEPWLLKNKGNLFKLGKKGKRVIVSGAPGGEIIFSLEKNIGKYNNFIDIIYDMKDLEKRGNGKAGVLMELGIMFATNAIHFCDDKPGSIEETSKRYNTYGIMSPGNYNVNKWMDDMKKAGAIRTFANVDEYCEYLINNI